MDWDYRDSDRELFEREFESFVPRRIYDSHVHLYDVSHMPRTAHALLKSGPAVAGWDVYRKRIDEVLPGRQISALCFGFPDPTVDFPAADAFVAQQIKADPLSRGQMLIHPSMDPEFIRESVRRHKFVGLKPYHVYAPQKPTPNAAIPDFLPAEHVRVAHEEGLSITLHIVRPRAMADTGNQEVLRDYSRRFPNAKIILAHAARGFNPHHTVEGMRALKGCGNIWCDTSAVTDGGAIEEIIRVLGASRVLYGSDFPITHIRGRCVAFGDSFLWLSESDLKLDQPYGRIEPVLIGLESLRVLKLACTYCGLSDSQVEGVFFGNAVEMLGLSASAR